MLGDAHPAVVGVAEVGGPGDQVAGAVGVRRDGEHHAVGVDERDVQGV